MKTKGRINKYIKVSLKLENLLNKALDMTTYGIVPDDGPHVKRKGYEY